jgi:hypothetical protein
MLTLSGGGRTRVVLDASPVMGAMMQLDPANAHSIMSYMSIKVCVGTWLARMRRGPDWFEGWARHG